MTDDRTLEDALRGADMLFGAIIWKFSISRAW